MIKVSADSRRFVESIRRSGLSIYDPIEISDHELWIPTPELQSLLDDGLRAISLSGLKLRTRSKFVKEKVCAVLGYPIPSSFKKVQPRFPGQYFDLYIQKTNNLQIWNEALGPSRRYVLVRVSDDDTIIKVKVVTGDKLARLDKTGTLTQKYQARLTHGDAPAALITSEDTEILQPFIQSGVDLRNGRVSPVDDPKAGELLPISTIFEQLHCLLGAHFPDPGSTQERNRGAELHRLVCQTLGYSSYQDDGQFPDVRHQLLEVKLQTSATIDLGLVRPNSIEPLDVPKIDGEQIRHCDVRYTIFCAVSDGTNVTLENLFLSTGEGFFDRFPQFQGMGSNKKLQIPLPVDFFN